MNPKFTITNEILCHTAEFAALDGTHWSNHAFFAIHNRTDNFFAVGAIPHFV